MKRFLPVLFAALILPAWSQSVPAPYQIAENNATPPPGTPPPADPATAPPDKSASAGNKTQAVIDQLTRSNRDLLDLLKKQQAVLEDIQYDRRLQNRQITLIEERLEDTLQANAALQVKIAKLQTEATDAASRPSTSDSSPVSKVPAAPIPVPTMIVPPASPVSYLPGLQSPGAPGTMWWHRLLAVSGDDSKTSGTFHITGRQWRVLWHNQDRSGDTYKNTSALFISAFSPNDTIPKKVCSQLGSGGDSTELTGSGDYYLKVEASGGHWEAAVEDFRAGPAGN